MAKGLYGRKGLFDLGDNVFKGKGISSLLDSRDASNKIIALFGGRENVPTSVMRPRKARTDAKRDKAGHERAYKTTGYAQQVKEKGLPVEAFGMSGMVCNMAR